MTRRPDLFSGGVPLHLSASVRDGHDRGNTREKIDRLGAGLPELRSRWEAARGTFKTKRAVPGGLFMNQQAPPQYPTPEVVVPPERGPE